MYTYIHIYVYLRATPPAAGPLDVDSGLLTSVLAVGELGTYRPRFSSLRTVWEIGSRSKMCLLRDQLLAQNFDALLAVIVKLVGDPTFAKFCQDAL